MDTEETENDEELDDAEQAVEASTEQVESFKLHKSVMLPGTTPLRPMLLGKPVTVRTSADAKRLLTKLISAFQRGQIVGRDAKDLCYLVVSFIQVCQQKEMEDRLSRLEEQR